MKFPGDNMLTLSKDSIGEILAGAIGTMLGAADVRILDVSVTPYPTRMKVEFTTDPLPVVEPPPVYEDDGEPIAITVETLAE